MTLSLTRCKRLSPIARTVAALACVASTGCATTSLSTYRDPASVGREPFTRLAIFAVVTDLARRQSVETLAVTRIKEETTSDAVRAIDLLPPTRTFTAEEAAAQLTGAGADGVLFVILTDAYVERYQAPGVSTTTGFGSVYGGSVHYQGQTIHQPGAQFSKPREAHELKLADLTTGDILWVSSSFTRGNAFAASEVMADSMLKGALRELTKERFVRAKPE